LLATHKKEPWYARQRRTARQNAVIAQMRKTFIARNDLSQLGIAFACLSSGKRNTIRKEARGIKGENTQRISIREITTPCINERTERVSQNCSGGGSPEAGRLEIMRKYDLEERRSLVEKITGIQKVKDFFE
jgi:hypothetical protein